MKCHYVREKTGRSGVRIDAYDALDVHPDIDFLFMDATPNVINANYIAVATALAFGDYADTKLQLPFTGDPETVAAISTYLSDTPVSISPMSEDTQIKASGTLALYVSPGPAGKRFPNTNQQAHTIALNLLPSDRYYGRLATMSGVDVGSNALNVTGFDEGHPLNLKRALAVALMYAAELQAGTVLVPPTMASAEQLNEFLPMFDAIGLGLEIGVLCE